MSRIRRLCGMSVPQFTRCSRQPCLAPWRMSSANFCGERAMLSLVLLPRFECHSSTPGEPIIPSVHSSQRLWNTSHFLPTSTLSISRLMRLVLSLLFVLNQTLIVFPGYRYLLAAPIVSKFASCKHACSLPSICATFQLYFEALYRRDALLNSKLHITTQSLTIIEKSEDYTLYRLAAPTFKSQKH